MEFRRFLLSLLSTQRQPTQARSPQRSPRGITRRLRTCWCGSHREVPAALVPGPATSTMVRKQSRHASHVGCTPTWASVLRHGRPCTPNHTWASSLRHGRPCTPITHRACSSVVDRRPACCRCRRVGHLHCTRVRVRDVRKQRLCRLWLDSAPRCVPAWVLLPHWGDESDFGGWTGRRLHKLRLAPPHLQPAAGTLSRLRSHLLCSAQSGRMARPPLS
jgi:hypothetical protein